MSADLAAAVAAMHAQLDDWAGAIVAAAGFTQGEEALSDPRLEAAEDEFEAAVGQFHAAASAVLGLAAPGADEDGPVVEVEEFALHLLVGLPEGRPQPERPPGELVHAAGERLVGELHSAGYEVPSWQFGCDLDLLLDEEDEP